MSGVDIEGLDEALQDLSKLEKRPAKFNAYAQRLLQQAVDRERTSHRYQNRSHSAETNTLLLRFGGLGGDAEITAEMQVEYASFLQRNNWSRFEELVKAALADIDAEAKAQDAGTDASGGLRLV